MESIVQIVGLSHRYSTNWAIRDINMEIKRSGIVGLLGSNGAGKSTTMNILCGVLTQTEGDVFIGGINLKKEPERAKQEIGFLPQTPPLYMDLTVDEYLRHCAIIRSVSKQKVATALEEVKQRCGLSHISKRLIRNLSGGYRQRVGIAQAIIHKPKLVVLDEPTNGLDPNQILEVRSLIQEIAQEHAVILSTHILTEVQYLCKDIQMIENGRIVFADTMQAFDNYVAPHSMLAVMEAMPSEQALLQIAGIARVNFLTERQVRLHFNGDSTVSERLVLASAQHGWRLSEISLEKNSLDETFAQLSKVSH
ncbi:ABC-2 type transport system ATP-binding protein [Chitinophaga costaii]|uniref:ABC-2 type transport system ATP-binding protein n=1 Tax=Chitinophaga costaii TaxID=1335309 RepID=A0A1C4EPB4_9BACT|nr:ABC transporter ATP-binding protein [Chitinophaga costaii]PUZ22493.1 ABC transporter ATP-binding protein [Chitinophaga costaii]SCC45475.1 ABC-2 type transport system ATP-binding protein [Chitinophaga costaii]